jgi:hypothetical protein
VDGLGVLAVVGVQDALSDGAAGVGAVEVLGCVLAQFVFGVEEVAEQLRGLVLGEVAHGPVCRLRGGSS